jgi:hypothetical protein
MEDFLVKKLSKLNYQALFSLIGENRIEFIPVRLAGAYGMTLPDRIYVDLYELRRLPDNVVYFVLLHEIFHYKRYQQLGKQHFINQLSNPNFEELHNHIIDEEMAADKYGCEMYRLFNGQDYPVQLTQMLDDPYRRSMYEKNTKAFFGQIKSEADFDNFWNKFIVN